MQSRRDFLKTIPLLSGTFVVTMASQKQSFGAATLKKDAGIQLWTLRDDVQKDLNGTLNSLSKFGYKSIETFGFDGKFYGQEVKDFARYCSDLGISIHSSHTGITAENASLYAEKAAEAGLSFLILPSMMGRAEGSLDDFRRTADEMNKIGKQCLKHGIRFGYHNHDFEFRLLEGKLPYDILLESTDPQLVSFQLDIYWIIKAGQDPYRYFERHPGRFSTWHLKDLGSNGKSCIIGNGRIDFRSLLEKAGQAGLERVFVEQEQYDEGTPLYCAEKSLKYIQRHLF
jgi:sugar phosphate isomerase/epimerase